MHGWGFGGRGYRAGEERGGEVRVSGERAKYLIVTLGKDLRSLPAQKSAIKNNEIFSPFQIWYFYVRGQITVTHIVVSFGEIPLIW